VIQSHPLISDAVEVGSLVDPSAIAADCSGCVIVCHDEQDIGSIRHIAFPWYRRSNAESRDGRSAMRQPAALTSNIRKASVYDNFVDVLEEAGTQ
jgi:hypothetical protein